MYQIALFFYCFIALFDVLILVHLGCYFFFSFFAIQTSLYGVQ